LTEAIRTKADVIAVGRGYYVDGKWEPMDVKKGDVIYFQGGIEIEKGILVISEKDVLAVIEEGSNGKSKSRNKAREIVRHNA